jgi:uncharacterized protein (DUF302 family)
MRTQTLEIRRLSIVSSKPFDDVLGRLSASIGQPDMDALRAALSRTKTLADLVDLVQGALGSSQLMEFARFDLGRILAVERGGSGPKLLRLIVGNPLIMKEMVRATPDAASYAPVTILVDERADGVHLSYDSTASLLAPYGSQTAVAIARALDAKVEGLLQAAAR